MDINDEAYDILVRRINKNFELGWTNSLHTWAALAPFIVKRQAARDQPIWGIRETYGEVTGKEILAPKRVSMVANAWAFHPLATPIRDVTYDEAIALHKLKN
jgi:hypothetical protein